MVNQIEIFLPELKLRCQPNQNVDANTTERSISIFNPSESWMRSYFDNNVRWSHILPQPDH